ncbi:hypothetical protein OG787_12205 [Streptomyces sp. NBC_00075]|uniref:hypothetical protein n=1 Tax=Streptomyces sp. NBC_00075 TaxID=2975641 RepID=UPI0032561661
MQFTDRVQEHSQVFVRHLPVTSPGIGHRPGGLDHRLPGTPRPGKVLARHVVQDAVQRATHA